MRSGWTRAGLVVAAVVLAAAVAPMASGAVEPEPRTVTVPSFDGVPIVSSLFLPPGAGPDHPVPVVFMTHGWGGHRSTSATGAVAVLLGQGYAVVSWDQRGFGDSGGEADLDSQEHEVRDVRALIDAVARTPGVALDGPGDPRMGMLGGSYAGAIQLMVAAADPRVDAIVPQIAWHDLVQSLEPGGVLKVGWGRVLYGAGLVSGVAEGIDSPAGVQTGSYSPQLHQALLESSVGNEWSPQTLEYYAARSPRGWLDGGVVPGVGPIPGVRAPTLLVQGTSDTLFPLNEAIATRERLAARGVPTKMVFFCGGHSLTFAGTSCTAGADVDRVVTRAVLDWLDRYVREPLGDAPTGAPLDYQVQDGTFVSAAGLPGTFVSASGGGHVASVGVPTSGALLAPTPSPDGFRFPVPVPEGATVLGVPRATLTVRGHGPEAYVFLKLLDVDGAGRTVVVDDQVAARKISGLSVAPQTVAVDLNGVAWKVAPGHQVFVEVSSTSNDHATARLPFVAAVDAAVAVPVVTPAPAAS